jgi:hypothetical protein
MRYWVPGLLYTNKSYLFRRLRVWQKDYFCLTCGWYVPFCIVGILAENANTGFKFGRTFSGLAEDANKFFCVAEIANNLTIYINVRTFMDFSSLILVSLLMSLSLVPWLMSLMSLASLPFYCMYLFTCLLSIFESESLTSCFWLLSQSTYVPRVPHVIVHCVCPLVRTGTPPPLSRKRVCPSPGTPGGGAYSPAVEGVGWSQFIRPEKKPSKHSVYSVVDGLSPLYLSRILPPNANPMPKNQTQSFSLLLWKYLLILKILPVTRFKDPKATILTLKMLTGSRLWFCTIIPEPEGFFDKLIPCRQWEVGTEKEFLRKVSVSFFKISN